MTPSGRYNRGSQQHEVALRDTKCLNVWLRSYGAATFSPTMSVRNLHCLLQVFASSSLNSLSVFCYYRLKWVCRFPSLRGTHLDLHPPSISITKVHTQSWFLFLFWHTSNSYSCGLTFPLSMAFPHRVDYLSLFSSGTVELCVMARKKKGWNQGSSKYVSKADVSVML